VFPELCCKVEFPAGRRIPFLAFLSVFLPEEPHVHVTPFNFVEIDLIGPFVNGGHVFKKKYIEEPAQQGISPEKFPQSLSLLGELLLNAAEEDADLVHDLSPRDTKPLRNPSSFLSFILQPIPPPG